MYKSALEHDALARIWLAAGLRHMLRAPAFWLGMIAISLAASVIAFGVLPGDVETSRSFQRLEWSWLVGLMEFGDLVGGKVWLFTLFGAMATCLLLFRRWKESSVLWLAAAFYVFSPVLKQAIGRPRPNLEGIEVLVNPVGYSFPSGHAMGSGLIIGGAIVVAFLVFRGNRLIQALAAGAGFGVLLIIGSSRVYLGAHWASDVIAGYALAAMFLLIALSVARWRFGRSETMTAEPELLNG